MKKHEENISKSLSDVFKKEILSHKKSRSNFIIIGKIVEKERIKLKMEKIERILRKIES